MLIIIILNSKFYIKYNKILIIYYNIIKIIKLIDYLNIIIY